LSGMELLDELTQHGVRLWIEDEHLRCRGPKSVLTPELKLDLERHKSELLDYLKWDSELAYRLLKDALDDLAKDYVRAGKPDYTLDAWNHSEAIDEAFKAEDMFALRIAIWEWVEEVLQAFEAAKDRGRDEPVVMATAPVAVGGEKPRSVWQLRRLD
jgi:hypothetical protein